MLDVCEEYAVANNLKYSTDPNPNISKSKSLYMIGEVRGQISHPKPVLLYGVPLPWVSECNHLGHTISDSCNLEEDTRCKRMQFISESTDVRDAFHFAHPYQILQAIQVYCSSFYSCMIWDIYGEEASKVFRCWNTSVKLSWNVPRNTFTFLVDRTLQGSFKPIRHNIISRYLSYINSLRTNRSQEVRILFNCIKGNR